MRKILRERYFNRNENKLQFVKDKRIIARTKEKLRYTLFDANQIKGLLGTLRKWYSDRIYYENIYVIDLLDALRRRKIFDRPDCFPQENSSTFSR